MNRKISNTYGTVVLTESSLHVAVTLLSNIVEMACEHEPDLGLMRLVNFMDLYRTYLAQELGEGIEENEFSTLIREPLVSGGRRVTECVSFEQFIGDTYLLQETALEASRKTGMYVAAPLPLKLSANSCSVTAV